MKKFISSTITLSIIIFSSCISDSKKADRLRIENRFEEAVELYQKAANEGDAYAKWRLSEAYSNGDGVEYNEEKALKLIKESSKEGCDEATCDLALAYIWGNFGLNINYERGKNIMDKLVKKTDNAYVQSIYAGLVFWGTGPYKEDKEKAVTILSTIKDKEDPEYLFYMGSIYLTGTNKIDIDTKKAINFYTKAFKNGDRRSSSILASIYGFGHGEIKRDISKQIEWLNRGIDSNDTDCMVEMAKLCLSEDSTYQDIYNQERAIELFKKAAKRGSGEANNQLGWLYYEGKNVEKDDEKSFTYYKEATKLKSEDGAFHLGFAYIDGVGCEKDLKKGIETWKLAVVYGSGSAANNLFCYYNNGAFGGKKDAIDKKKAKDYLLRAAELNSAMGCFNLGKEYFSGNNLMEKNDSQAFIYIKKAADAGVVDACTWIAYFYENGIGCDKDPNKAKKYKDMTTAKEVN